MQIIRKVFERYRIYKLRMNPLKCVVGVSIGKFLEFLVHNRRFFALRKDTVLCGAANSR